MNDIPTAELLRECGLETAAYEMEKQQKAITPELKQKLRIAFEHFRVVEPHHIEAFNKKLRWRTKTSKVIRSTDSNGRRHKWRCTSFQQLEFTRLHNYMDVPPVQVLQKLAEAKKLECFDWFEVATVAWKDERIELPPKLDPILFGRIDQSDKRYFITQWDDDVKIEDILKEDEG